jgi:hypothetical protein
MAQAGYTPISLYYSTTAAAAPTAGNLVQGELAINITDGKLFYEDNAGAVQVIAWKTTPATAGGTGQTSYTTGDLLYASSSTALSKLGIGSNGQVLGVSGGVLAYITPSGTTGSSLTIALTGGAAAPATFNGSSAVTIDYSTVGADQVGTGVAMAIALG